LEELLGFAMDAFSLEEYHPSSEPNKLIFGTQPSKDQSILSYELPAGQEYH